ncbi:MAG TPA: hypothetical protein VHL11_15030, partial [Phototrophicaceae bacterium]|nr:hypothetical protein [Phototrophicaceae bacterium]
MKLDEQYLGTNDGFEGDRTLWLRSLPANAQVTRALVTIKPALPPQPVSSSNQEDTEKVQLFEETIIFPEGSSSLSEGNWGA